MTLIPKHDAGTNGAPVHRWLCTPVADMFAKTGTNDLLY